MIQANLVWCNIQAYLIYNITQYIYLNRQRKSYVSSKIFLWLKNAIWANLMNDLYRTNIFFVYFVLIYKTAQTIKYKESNKLIFTTVRAKQKSYSGKGGRIKKRLILQGCDSDKNLFKKPFLCLNKRKNNSL